MINRNIMIKRKRLIASVVTITLLLGLIPYALHTKPMSKAAEHGLSNPRVAQDDTITWDCVYFGNYWQNDTNGDGKADQNDEKEPIKWRVLSVDGDDAFLLADKNLDCQRYNKEYMNVTWETCTLRQWLNSDFYENAFDSSEQNAVLMTTVVNEDNPKYGTEGGNNTSDKVFLLSIGEASNPAYGFRGTYNEGSKTRESKNTEYAKECGGHIDAENNGWWWLRSPGNDSNYAAGVYRHGFFHVIGNVVVCNFYVVRPALHLNLSSSKWSKAGTVSSSGAGSGGVTSTATATPTPTITSTIIPTATPTQKVTSSPTQRATPTPTITSTIIPTATPTQKVTFSPTQRATPTPTITSTIIPTATPTQKVTSSPTQIVTVTPTATPTITPNNGQNNIPTSSPDPSIQPKESPKVINEPKTVTAPAKVKGLSAKNKKKKSVTLSWKKVKGASGYQIQYVSDAFAKKKVKNTKKTKFTIKKLKKKKTYSFRVRAYKINSGIKVCGNWCKAKKVKIKK